MASFECPNCGNIVPETDKRCKYCGTANPLYKAPPKPLVFSAPQSNSTSSNGSSPSTPQKSNFSVLIFILLLFFFWPGAIIYAIVASAKK